jgi:hypothetical protein
MTQIKKSTLMSSLTQNSSLVSYHHQDDICLTTLLVVLISLRPIASYLCFLLVLLHKGKFCNGCITKQCLNNSLYSRCNIMIFFQNYSVMKDDRKKNSNVFCHVLHYIIFFMNRKLFVAYLLQVLTLSRSTVCWWLEQFDQIYQWPGDLNLKAVWTVLFFPSSLFQNLPRFLFLWIYYTDNNAGNRIWIIFIYPLWRMQP